MSQIHSAIVNGRKHDFVSVTDNIDLEFEGRKLVMAIDWHYVNRISDAYRTKEELDWFKKSREYGWAYKEAVEDLKKYREKKKKTARRK